LIVDGECVLRYDNERGKGDHRHFRDRESAHIFVSLETLMDDFHADVQRLIEHGLIEKDAGDHVLVPWDDVVVRMDASLMRLAA